MINRKKVKLFAICTGIFLVLIWNTHRYLYFANTDESIHGYDSLPTDRLLNGKEVCQISNDLEYTSFQDIMQENKAKITSSVYYMLNLTAINSAKGADISGISEEMGYYYGAKLWELRELDFREAIFDLSYSSEFRILLLDLWDLIPSFLLEYNLTESDILGLLDDSNMALAALNLIKNTQSIPEEILIHLIDGKGEATNLALRIYCENNPYAALDKIEEMACSFQEMSSGAIYQLGTIWKEVFRDKEAEGRIFDLIEQILSKSKEKRHARDCASVLTIIGGKRSAELIRDYSDIIGVVYVDDFIERNPDAAVAIGLTMNE